MCRLRLLLVAAFLAACAATTASKFYAENSLFFETFDKGWESRWIHSRNSRFAGRFKAEQPAGWEEAGLQIPDKSRFYGISTLTKQPIDVADNFVVQYEVKFTEGITCGGAYLKLLTFSSGFTPESLTNETPYSVMFGPDVCGGNSKVHLILRHRNPKTGTVTEKHLKSPPSAPTDEQTHLYTLILNSAANKYEILIDGETQAAGSLMKDFDPPFAPKKEVLDPSDKKPVDWVDDAKIPDPSATKPADWDDRVQIPDESAKKPSGWLDDEPATIPDPSAKEPEDWDDEEDGAWEPPTIPNPKCKVGCGEWTRPLKHNPAYKGPWSPPLIDNPAFKGVWKQRKLPNPAYYEEKRPLQNVGEIGAVAIEVWTVDAGYTFDNILLANDPSVAREYRDRAWRAKKKAEDAAEGRATRDLSNLAEVAEALLDRPSLSGLKPVLQPVLDAMKKYPPVAYGVVLVVFTVVFYLLAICLASLKNNHPEAKRRRQEEAKKAARRAEKLRKAAARKKDDGEEEEEEESDEEEEEEEGEEEEEIQAGKEVPKGKAKQAAAAAKAAVEASKRAERNLTTLRWAQQAAAATTQGASSAGEKLTPVQITEIEEDSDDEGDAAAAAAARARQRKPKA